MKKKLGFSLAEALITLLIIAVITVLSAPVITKKARKREDTHMWTFIRNKTNYIYPTNNNDIMLGSTKQPRGIIVNGILVFKNTKGEIIGWIAEDGTNSFSMGTQETSLPQISDEEMKRIVKQVQNSIDIEKLSQQVQNPVRNNKTKQQKAKKASGSNASSENSENTNTNIDMEALIKTINQLNSQQR